MATTEHELSAWHKPLDSDAEQPARRFNVQTADEFLARTLPHPRWVIQNVWPEDAQGFIAGPPKGNKSGTTEEFVVCLSTGTPFLGLTQFFNSAGPQPVLYINAENGEGRIHRDLGLILEARGLGVFEEEVVDVQAHLADPNDLESEVIEEEIKQSRFVPFEAASIEKLHVLNKPALALELEADQEWIAAYVAEHGIRYLVIDPLYLLSGLPFEKDPSCIKPLLAFFTRLKADYGCAVVLVHHQTSKHSNGSAASRMMGSTYLYGWYDAALYTTRDEMLFTIEVDATRDLGVQETYTLTGLGVGKWSYDPHVQRKTDTLGRKSPRSAEREAQITKLGQLLADNPDATRKELAAALGVTERTVSTYRQDLAVRDAG